MCSLVMIFDKGQKTARTKFICKDCNPKGHAEEPLCGHCKYWDVRDHERETKHTGDCVRHAPIAIVKFTTGWPKTQGGNWCGDFERYKKDA